MVYIIIEDQLRDTTWCSDILNGAIPELCKNKLKYKICLDLDREAVEGNSFALILSSTINWAKMIVAKCEKKNIKPVSLVGFLEQDIPVSIVQFDYKSVMRELNKFLCSKQKKRTALFAFKNTSPANVIISKYFLEYFKESTQQDIYIRTGRTSECFDVFVKNADKYDSVICSNAHTAVYLVNKLKELNYPVENILFVSVGDSILLSKSFPSFVVVSQTHSVIGKTGVTIIKALIRHPSITSLKAFVECNIFESGKLLSSERHYENNLDLDYDYNLFDTNDYDISEITKIEMLLKGSTLTERTIIDMIISNLTYEEIADICSLSISTVKYHSKKIFQALDCSSRKEFVKLFEKYNYNA